MVILDGLMIKNIKVFGKIMLCMVKAFFYGLMGESMMVSIKMEKKMGLGNFYGLMEGSIEVSGKITSRMGEEYLSVEMERKEQEFGVMVGKLNGLIDLTYLLTCANHFKNR